jgi:phage antirepressor YoqD-like protein
MEIKKFDYNGSEITFEIGSEVIVNATEMAKPFGKRPVDWLRLSSTTEFMETLSSVRKSHTSMIQTVMGSPETGGGTWLHEDVALEFARWLSPVFAIWCNDRIKELLKFGMTTTPEATEKILGDPDFGIRLLLELKSERAKISNLERENTLNELRITEQVKVITQSKPKVDYFDEVLSSDDLVTTTVVAKGLGMTAAALNKLLHKNGIIYKVGGTWVLYLKHQNKGLTGFMTYTYSTDKNGNSIGVKHNLMWTEKGKHFIHQLCGKLKHAGTPTVSLSLVS